ncbi:MAG: solute carrier family 23 protein [Micrococcaceae bacterium]
MALWKVHGDGKQIKDGEVVSPDERLNWPFTITIGLQHVIAMFGATFLVPLLTGFPPTTTLLFSGLGTLLFLLITQGKVPSYLGSSFAFIAPLAASTKDYGMSGALGGIVMAGITMTLIGLIAHFAGVGWIEKLMPPVVTGSILALIGFNLAPSAKQNFMTHPLTGFVTLASIILVGVIFKGMIGRLSIIIGVLIGYIAAVLQGEVDFSKVGQAAWIGLPPFHHPSFHMSLMPMFIPVILALVAENIGHLKAVALMTGKNLDPYAGRALMGDGLSTVLAGSGGGSATTTYAENIGVMAATKVYSTAAYAVAGLTAILLSFSPKFGAIISTIPQGVLGGAATVLYGMIGILGVRIWIDNKVDFSVSKNMLTAAVALIIGIADYTWNFSNIEFSGIALGTAAAIIIYHVINTIEKRKTPSQSLT